MENVISRRGVWFNTVGPKRWALIHMLEMPWIWALQSITDVAISVPVRWNSPSCKMLLGRQWSIWFRNRPESIFYGMICRTIRLSPHSSSLNQLETRNWGPRFKSKIKPNKAVVDNRLLAPSRHDPLYSHTQPCFGVALPVACATLWTFS